ncbi:hypothetical protein [Streptomyces sp. NPDC048340]|uniref:hypothetical protein n=1 Tax=Streptomyces sp. NPDC048340 TaxID=3365537 RepID=UPI0037140CF6
MLNRKISSAFAAAALPLGVLSLQIAGAGTATASIPAGCSTSYSNGGQTGNVTCGKASGSATSQVRAVVTCRNNAGNTFTVYGEWTYRPGTSSGTCSLNGTAGVSSIDTERRNKG